MKICIPVLNDLGPDSPLFDHFGSAPMFALADTDTGHVFVTPNGGRRHGQGQCSPVDHIDVERTDAVVCQGMGQRALQSLTSRGVRVCITTGKTVREVVAQARRGALRSLTGDEACPGHEHGHL